MIKARPNPLPVYAHEVACYEVLLHQSEFKPIAGWFDFAKLSPRSRSRTATLLERRVVKRSVEVDFDHPYGSQKHTLLAKAAHYYGVPYVVISNIGYPHVVCIDLHWRTVHCTQDDAAAYWRPSDPFEYVAARCRIFSKETSEKMSAMLQLSALEVQGHTVKGLIPFGMNDARNQLRECFIGSTNKSMNLGAVLRMRVSPTQLLSKREAGAVFTNVARATLKTLQRDYPELHTGMEAYLKLKTRIRGLNDG